MNHLTEEEKRALDLMQKKNFRGISKDDILELISLLDKVNPEVAKELIAQMPEGIRSISDAQKYYSDLLSKGIESCGKSTASCYETEDVIINSLQHEIEREGTDFEQKQYYYEKMESAAQRKESKDTEHNNRILSILKLGGQIAGLGICICAALFLGKVDFRFPGSKSI